MKQLWLKRIIWGVTLVAMTVVCAAVGRIGGSTAAGAQEGNPWVIRGSILLLATMGIVIAGLRLRRQRS
jgi:hypothetical protein